VAKTKLRQLLEYMENTTGGYSLETAARELDVSVRQAENMLDFWIRKGRIRKSAAITDCGSCASSGECPFILDMLTTYEFVKEGDPHPVELIHSGCK